VVILARSIRRACSSNCAMLSRSEISNRLVSLAIVGLIAVGLGGVIGFALYKFEPIYVVAGVLAAIVALITILNVEIGLLALVVITYTRLSDVVVHTYNAPSIAKPFMGLLIVAIVLQWLFYARPPRNWGKATLLVLAFGVVTFASLFYASDFTLAVGAIDDFWKDGLIAVIVVLLLRNGASLRHVMWAFILVGIFLGSISVYQYLTGTFTNEYWGFGVSNIQNIAGSTEGYRIAGPIGDPNFYAQIMLVLVPISFQRFMDEKAPVLRALALLATGLTVLTVIFTFSRGAFLALAAMGMILFWFNPPKPTQLVLAILLGVVLIRFVPTDYTERLTTLTDLFGGSTGVQSDISFQGRASELTAAWLMFADHPIFGVGVQNYPVYYQQYSRRIGLDSRTEARQAHSMYFQVAAEMGLMGLIVFGVILWNIFSSIWSSWKRLKNAGEELYANMVLSVLIGTVGYFSAAFFIHAAYPRYWWLITGVALAIPQVADSILAAGAKDKND
jgi:putative inorganic carbon (hco3(-)) transporter